MPVYAAPGQPGSPATFASRYDNWIGGARVAPVKGQYFENVSPVNGQVFTKIALPLVKPALAAVAVFSLIFSWNEFLFALILTQNQSKTIPVSIQAFSSSMGINWGPFMATAFIAILPIMIFTFIMQRYLVRGLTFGAVK